MVRKRRKKAQREEVNWQEYFLLIKGACPWSHQAYKNNQIEFVEFTGEWLMDIGTWEARIYIVDRKPRLLKKWADRLNEQDDICEWLWSHPNYGHLSAPVPIIIQQPRRRLDALRAVYKG